MVSFWTPTPTWKDLPAYIVGGGPSLISFEWSKLQGRACIGCNVAYQLGPEVVPVVLFGDGSFFLKHRTGLADYARRGGVVVTCSSKIRPHPIWLKKVRRKPQGYGTDCVGWNGNTGAAAINLALLLGANPIYLLGFDMQVVNGKGHYHNQYPTPPNPDSYSRFKNRIQGAQKELQEVFPGRQVINLEDGTSELSTFPKQSLKGHFNG